ncbi:lysine--tRNA ligase [Helicobacter mehlei]|uniref:Lysine--tRNA ligase n=1 Tax=Helicobacter mehlei TaxID=2316080 RepID=A0A553V2D6_9HELI|nr:lysine--tRNA ligase [Helicobacter mehlei]TSA86643.1 lysine--tRNA ligase [Helicobacter mehlei]
MFDNPYIQQRIQKGEHLRQMALNPYDNQVTRTLENATFLEHFKDLHAQEESKDPSSVHALVGRVRFVRLMGKACFMKIEDQSALVQVYLSQNDVGKEGFENFKKCVEVGDILNVTGYPFVTKTGELSLHATTYKILTKAIVPLPEKFHGLSDIELRYRQRYVDLIANPEVKEVFKTRSQVVAIIRRFFEQRGFLEVETPMMHPIAGGANARPFITYHNALEVERYLRIAPELYLKRLVVGGFEAVFEINRNFRNEGMDHSHNPEFTMLEFYWAYKTYEDLIALTQELFHELLKTLQLPTQIPYQDLMIDFNAFSVMSFRQALLEIGGIALGVLEDPEQLRDFLTRQGVTLEVSLNYGQLLAQAFDLLVEPKLINPTFITQYPIEISPLARRNDRDPSIADRFELFIAGKEIANGFSELNDPIDQYTRFEEQVKAKEQGDEEAQFMDEDYVWALGHGMPPTAGEGIGIDRLVMLLTNAKSIKDVILFPAMKPLPPKERVHE